MKYKIECNCKNCPHLIRDAPTAIRDPNFIGMCTTYIIKELEGQIVLEHKEEHSFWKGDGLTWYYRDIEDVPPECEAQILTVKELNNIWEKVLLRDFY